MTEKPEKIVTDSSAPLNSNAMGALRAFVEQLETLDQERTQVVDDMKEVFAGVKASGFNVAIVRKLLKIRKQDAAKLREEEEVLDMYKGALDPLS